MMNNSNFKGFALVALFASAMTIGAVSAHAQSLCYQTQVQRDAYDLVNMWGPYGWYQVQVPCIHWIRVTVCN
jgi:hypothetical protein